MTSWSATSFFAQLLLVPFLSASLGFQDTTFIIIAISLNIIDYFSVTMMTQPWFLFVSWAGFQILWNNMFTCAYSALSKLCKPTEVGKLLSVLQLARMSVSLLTDAGYNYLYQATLSTVPATPMYVGLCLLVLDLVLVIYLHVDMEDTDVVEEETEVAKIDHS